MAIKVPPGQYPPFEVVHDQHHAGIIIITAAICLVISLVCLLIRVYVRFLLSSSFGSDDLILLGATVCLSMRCIYLAPALCWDRLRRVSHFASRYAVSLSQLSFSMPLREGLGRRSRCCIVKLFTKFKRYVLFVVSMFSVFLAQSVLDLGIVVDYVSSYCLPATSSTF